MDIFIFVRFFFPIVHKVEFANELTFDSYSTVPKSYYYYNNSKKKNKKNNYKLYDFIHTCRPPRGYWTPEYNGRVGKYAIFNDCFKF